MCRRFVSPDQFSIEADFDLVRSDWEFPANFNVAPTQSIPVIRVIEGQPDPVLLTWGFGEHDTANFPVEALRSGADAHGLLQQGQRCVIPAVGFYAWRVSGGTRTPYYIHAEDQDIVGLAGFWERESCTILTVPANAMMAEIDNAERRMPAILSREMREVWLYGSAVNAAAALAAYPDEQLVAYPVSSRVNSVEPNDETLIEPLETNVD